MSQIRVIRRGDGVRITQGKSYVLAGPNELADLINELTAIHKGSLLKAEMTKIEHNT